MGNSAYAQHIELGALEMATTMSAGMAAWMRYRGHGRAGTLEMVSTVLAPLVVLLLLFGWAPSRAGR